MFVCLFVVVYSNILPLNSRVIKLNNNIWCIFESIHWSMRVWQRVNGMRWLRVANAADWLRQLWVVQFMMVRTVISGWLRINIITIPVNLENDFNIILLDENLVYESYVSMGKFWPSPTMILYHNSPSLLVENYKEFIGTTENVVLVVCRTSAHPLKTDANFLHSFTIIQLMS